MQRRAAHMSWNSFPEYADVCSFISGRYSAKSEVSLDVAVSMHDVVLGPVWSSTLCKILTGQGLAQSTVAGW